jgi:urease accessory protein
MSDTQISDSARLAHILQLMDSLFPVGAFAYSDGLESAAAGKLVHDASSLAGWLDHFIDAVFVPCEGLALLKCMRAAEQKDWGTIRSIDEELTALKPAAATRAGSRSVGKRLLTTYGAIAGRDIPFLSSGTTLPHCNAPVAYALALSHRGVGCGDALVAFGYVRLAGIVSAALRLVALGQQQGQALLTRAIDHLLPAAERVLRMEDEPLRSFGPHLDIQQMNHRYLYSRLFRS